MRPPGHARRMAALVVKETLQVVRDPSAIAIAFVMPVVLLLLFGYGVSLDAREVPLALVVESPTEESNRFIASFANSPWFAVDVLPSRQEAEAGLIAGTYRGMVVLGADFARRLERAGQAGTEAAPIQLVLDGTDANTGRLVQGYVEGAWAKWLQLRGLEARKPLAVPVSLEARAWFNPEVRSRDFLVPGLIAIIMTLIGTLLTALVVAREWERGTMEALMTTPVTVGELMVGKLVPYFVLGMGSMALSVVLGVGLFGVPLRGSFAVLALVSAVFLVAALALGLLISTNARNQFVAGQIAIVAAFLPAFMLSGFLFEIGSMPPPIQVISHIVAARYFVACLQTLFLAGDLWSVILPNLAALAAMAAALLGLTARRTAKRLD